jgi:hypothetical protein
MVWRRALAAFFLPPVVYYTVSQAPLGIGGDWPIWHWGLPIAALVFALVAVLGTWSWRADRTNRLVFALETTLRYCLAYLLLSFGIAKIYPGQFVSYNRDLDLTLGAVSPFRLAWRFFGYSPVYVGYIASLEILAAALLSWPRTAVLGLLFSLGLMSNITVIDLAFRIPPLALAATMGLVSLFLLVGHVDRLRALLAPLPNVPAATARTGIRGFLVGGGILAVMAVLLVRDGYTITRSLSAHAPPTGRWEILGCSPNMALSVCQPTIDSVRPKLYLEIGRWGELLIGAERQNLTFTYEPSTSLVVIDAARGSIDAFPLVLQGPVSDSDSIVTLRASAAGTVPFDVRLLRTQRLPWFTRRKP